MGDLIKAHRRTYVAPRAAAAGFTLIELMVAVLAAAILAAIAVPSFESTMNNSRLTTAGNELLISVQTARMEALRFNRRTVMCLSRNPTAATPACAPSGATDAVGWITFVDANRNDAYNTGVADEVLLRRSTVPQNIQVLASSNIPNRVAVTFRSDGFARNSTNNQTYTGAIDVCMPTRRPEQNIRRLVVGAGSRMAIEKASNPGLCTQPSNP